MAKVGIRELRNHLSRYLKQVKAGEWVTVTERGKAIAWLIPAQSDEISRELQDLLREGLASWGGGKPAGAMRPAPVHGRPISEIVVEDRR